MRAREITIAASLALHAFVGWGALHAAHEKKLRRATTVAIADEKKREAKKPEPPKPPPPPPPKAKPVAPKPAVAPAPVQAAAPVEAPVSAPIASEIAMTNEIGMDPGGARVRDESKPVAPVEKTPKPAAAPHDKPLHVDAPPPKESVAGACTEPAGKPEPTMKTEIEYTQDARAAGVEGRLVLEVTVDADGNVTAVKVISSVEPALDAAAIATVKTWRFKPALACGKPVAGGVYRIARRFELSD
jgi:protein TonB